VRLHDNANARQALKETSAKGLAQGHDIALHPEDASADTAQKADLMRHEIGHTVQQAAAGAGTLTQRDGDAAEGGIGTHPPEDHFVTMDSAGAEDEYLLFGQDSATLTPAALSTLAAMTAGLTGEMAVMIHGYASLEGADDYNRNLSAHRAVAVRDALLPLLPAGTGFILYAHGETDHFGDGPNNRRTGVDLITPQDGSFLSGLGPLSLFPRRPRFSLFAPGELDLQQPGAAQPTAPDLSGLRADGLAIERAVPSPEPVSGPSISPVALQLLAPPPPLFDTDYNWGAVARDAGTRGVRFTDGDHQSITGHYTLWRQRFFQMGLSADLATQAAQFGTDIMVGTYLSNEHPNPFEVFDRRWGTEPPPTITILNETRMIWIYERFRDAMGGDK
jgi:outer membrane protein OmpA-like peptidoglycan-associated protein